MNIDLTNLKNRSMKKLRIHENLEISQDLLEDTELLDLKDVMVDGTLFLDSLDEYQVSLEISGTMILPCAITLKPVPYPFHIEVEGNIEELMSEIDENVKKSENSIDIFPIIWENILMEIPLRVVAEDAKEVTMAGEGWKFVTDTNKQGTTNSEFDKLKDLF